MIFMGGTETMKTGREVIENVLKKEKVKKAELGRRFGMSRQALYSVFQAKTDVTAVRFFEMLALLGYTVDVRKVGYRKVLPEKLEQIEATKEPKGLFFCERGGVFVVADNRTQYFSEAEFNTEEECLEYLDTID